MTTTTPTSIHRLGDEFFAIESDLTEARTHAFTYRNHREQPDDLIEITADLFEVLQRIIDRCQGIIDGGISNDYSE